MEMRQTKKCYYFFFGGGGFINLLMLNAHTKNNSSKYQKDMFELSLSLNFQIHF